MSLEAKTKKTGFFKRIARGAFPYIFAASLGLAIMGCKEESGFKEAPGPISVENYIAPSSVPSGGTVYWGITVTNNGGKATISNVHVHEVAISGWAVGYYDFSGYLSIGNNEISAHNIETIFSQNVPVWNTGPNDVTFENTVTVNSDGGSASDTSTYIVRSMGSSSLSGKLGDAKESSEPIRGVVRGLSDLIK